MPDIPSLSNEQIVKEIQRRGEQLQWQRDYLVIREIAREIAALASLLPFVKFDERPVS